MRSVKIMFIGAALVAAVIVAVLAAMIAFGTASPPPPLASIGSPFRSISFTDLPKAEQIASRDGTLIAFRQWPAAAPQSPERVVIAIHGSSATSSSMHALAKAIAAAGMTVYAPDIRGHGGTGRRGDIDYRGQLDDDMADFIAAIKARHAGAALVLTGFSAGGGFALHVAGSAAGSAFERTVLLSPMLGIKSPTVKARGDAWAKPYLPRIIGLAILNRVGIHSFDHLPVLRFAIMPERADILTPEYSWRLLRAFATRDFASDLRGATVPLAVLVGEKDELFQADLFQPTVHAVKAEIPVTVVPDLSHIEMITDARAVPPILAAIRGDR